MFTFCILTRPVVAQHPPDSTDTFGFIETLVETLHEEADPSHLIDGLTDLVATPLDVNTASVDQLAEIPFLGATLARSIVAYRDTNGPFHTLDDLLRINAMTNVAFRASRPFLMVTSASASPPFLKRLTRNRHLELIQHLGRHLDPGRGYRRDTTHAGSAYRVVTRLRAHTDLLSFNLTMDKDPGERFAWDPLTRTYGFDHVTGHLALQNAGWLKTLIIGDYAAAFGQGVALWRSSSFGKGSHPIRPLIRTGKGFIPYRSTEENRFFRGLAATIALPLGIAVSAFASHRSLDAVIDENPPPDGSPARFAGSISSLSTSGLHRTPSELAKKDGVREKMYGATVDFQSGPLRLGLTGYHSRFDLPFQASATPSRRFQFAGDRASMASVYADLFLGKTHLFGEAARAPTSSFGGIGGVALYPTDHVQILLLARHYPPAFVSLHGHAFGERNGATTNETGYYAGIQSMLTPRWRVAAYVDQYRIPWVLFGTPRPSTGYETRLLIEHRPRRWLLLSLQGRSETRERGSRVEAHNGTPLDAVQPETHQSMRLQGDYSFSTRLQLRARLEVVRHRLPHTPASYGHLLLQDMRWHPGRTIQIDLRLAFFDTDGYATRIFTFERDLRNTFSLPALSGKGLRSYLLVRWTPSRRLSFQGKIATTHVAAPYTSGSGLGEVNDNKLREIRAQVRWRL